MAKSECLFLLAILGCYFEGNKQKKLFTLLGECYFEYNNEKKHSCHHFETDEYIHDILTLASFSFKGHFCEN